MVQSSLRRGVLWLDSLEGHSVLRGVCSALRLAGGLLTCLRGAQHEEGEATEGRVEEIPNRAPGQIARAVC